MAKMFAKTMIIMPNDIVVKKGAVFDCTPAQAKQFDGLKSARPATADEIAAAATAAAIADGSAFIEPEVVQPVSVKPMSNAPGDPQGAPKGKTA